MVKKISRKELDKIKNEKDSSVIPAAASKNPPKVKKVAPPPEDKSLKVLKESSANSEKIVKEIEKIQRDSTDIITKAMQEVMMKISKEPLDYRLHFVRNENELLDYIDIKAIKPTYN